MLMWEELSAIGDSIVLTEEDDSIMWSFNSNGQFSVQSLYAIINHRGVTPIFVHAVWKLNIPPRVQFFLWLLSHNRLLTRDNLARRRRLATLLAYSVMNVSRFHTCFFSVVLLRACLVSTNSKL